MNFAIIWVLLSAWLCAVGWMLSAAHFLNKRGYLLALALTLAGALLFKKSWWPASGFHGPNWRKLWRRFRRPAPLIVLGIMVLALTTGIYRFPENGDSSAYRIPRMLHWVAQSGWHWIRTDDSRQNMAGCGYEWLCAPLVVLVHSERWIFLPNVVAYFLLPGLLFSMFRRFEIASRAAWWWSWLVATGWCYTMQACTTDNDSLATVYALAALVFALRARENKKVGDVWIALLAAAVLTSVKPTNLPLLLPCFVALWPSWRLFFSRPVASSAIIVLAALASFLPTAFLNWHYAGSWRGYVGNPGEIVPGPAVWWQWGRPFALPSPFWGIVGNSFYLVVQNLLPPFFPWAGAWNQAMLQFVQTPLGSHFAAFEGFGHLNRSATSASSGLGLCVVFVVLVSVFSIRLRCKPVSSWVRPDFFTLLCWAPWLAILAFMAKVGACQNARYLAPYYPLLLLPLLRQPGIAGLVRHRWWQRLVLLVMSATFAFMVFENGRQLVPSSVFVWLQDHPQRPKAIKILDAYYQARVSVAAYRDFATRHAAGEKVVGYATKCGGLEVGMWQPWGHGRVERILPDDSPAWVRSRGITGVFVGEEALRDKNETLQQWLDRFDAKLVDQMSYATDAGKPPTNFYFCRLNHASEPAAPAPPTSTLTP
jgi:hypothetical protein